MWLWTKKNIDEKTIRNKLFNVGISNCNISLIRISDSDIKIIINIDISESSKYKTLKIKAEKALGKIANKRKIHIIITSEKKKKEKPAEENHTQNIKKIVAIASGKGGVGKSTVAINLACGLSKQGLKIGLLDADIYGPSVPRLAGLSNKKPDKGTDKMMLPIEKFGIKFMSIGFVIEEGTSVIWRGPMIQGALIQMIRDVEWGEIDVLIVDMPPGTGDIQLGLCQKYNIDGAVIVSTPQDMALIDAKKAIDMFEKLNVPVIGMIENMSNYTCSECGHEEHIFGHGGAKKYAKEINVDLLAEIPLDITVRLLSDEGIPIVIQKEKSKSAQEFLKASNSLEHILGL